jgi:hypothetical protein
MHGARCRISAHGEQDLACAPAYTEYARALLRKAQAEGDPFGGALSKKGEAKPQAGGSGVGASSSSDQGAGATADDEGDAVDDDDADAGGGGDGEGEGEEESDDLELAFQCFEVARIIYEKAGASHELPLADVLECLGEVSMENEMWEDAVGELERSLGIKRRLLGEADRQVAHLHYQVATAAVAQGEKARHDIDQPPPQAPDEPPFSAEACEATIARCRTLAAQHYGHAADVLERAAGAAESSDAAELAELLAEVRAKAEEQQQPTEAAPEPPPPAMSAGVTTIGFGESNRRAGASSEASVTTIGFGSQGGASTSTGFSAPSATVLPVKNLGVVGRGAKRVRLDE